MCMYTWYPTSRQYHDVCATLVSKHAFLRDRTGQGYMSDGKEAVIQVHTSATSAIKGIEDSYSIQMHVARMKECKKANPNIDILKEKMKRTFAERVGFIQSHSTSDILQEFPALQHISIILTEIEHIFKVDVDKRLLEGFGKAADKIIAEAKRRRLGKEILLQYQTALSQECEETHKGHTVCAAILLLPYLFHENPDRLYVIDKVANAPTPVLLISGNPFSAGCEMSLRIDGMDIVKPEDISMGVGALLGIYFIFGVKYAENVKKTLNFLQCMVGINSNDKVPIGVIKMVKALL
ncbi:hypothetical protein DPEC_G00286690 [Dallia pectoralis]|uniref:Uncharacterized protein n=1 Tax=Dallia pectoralis TaxID=75939 RepID=A0ACC2FJY7_DALPE|nr:hypothetical protein DPEC_G00286690 [Dallia pectoralis]